MGHPGNWSDRKVASVRAQNAAADKAELATCELHDHGPDQMVANLTPCTTFNLMHYGATVQCAGCMHRRALAWREFARTRISHEPWHVIFRTAMTCRECDHGPLELSFSRVPVGGGAAATGCISRRPPPQRRV